MIKMSFKTNKQRKAFFASLVAQGITVNTHPQIVKQLLFKTHFRADSKKQAMQIKKKITVKGVKPQPKIIKRNQLYYVGFGKLRKV